jgi:sodium/pantothenate symporter
MGIKFTSIAGSEDEAGFLLAGRSLGFFVGAATLVATGFSGWCFMGSPGVAYSYGTVEVLANFFFAFAIVIASLFFGNFLRRRAGELGCHTIPEYIAKQHGSGKWEHALQAVAAVISIMLLLVFLMGQIKAVGLLCSSWLEIPMVPAAFIMIALIIFYTTAGGLAAVAWTDTLMVLGMLLGSMLIMFQIFGDMGLTELVSNLREADPNLVSPETGAPYGETKIGPFLLIPYAFLWAAVLPYMCVRFLALKHEVKMHQLGLVAAVFSIILSLIPIVGLYMRVKMPGLSDPDQAMPEYLHNFLHPGWAAMITLFILFAMKSTVNSILHTVSSAVSYDIRQAFFAHKNINARKARRINRMAVVILGMVGFFMMVYAPPAFINWLSILGTGTLLAAMCGPVFISTFWKGNALGAMVAMLSGFATSAVFLLFAEVGWMVGPLLGALVSSVLYIAVSIITFKAQPRAVDRAERC